MGNPPGQETSIVLPLNTIDNLGAGGAVPQIIRSKLMSDDVRLCWCTSTATTLSPAWTAVLGILNSLKRTPSSVMVAVARVAKGWAGGVLALPANSVALVLMTAPS